MAVAEAEVSATEKMTGIPLVDFVKAGARERDKITADEKAAMEAQAKPSPEAIKDTSKAETPKTTEKPALGMDTKKADAAPDIPKAEVPDEKKDKQIKDTRDALTQERKANLELQRKFDSLMQQMTVVNQKLDGTYEDKKAPKRSEEQIEAESEYKAKIKASEKLARKKYGDEEITSKITAKDSPYMVLEREHQWIGPRVGFSDDPIEEAMQVLWEEDKFKEHGTRNLKAILEKEIQAALEAKRDELVKEATDEINGKGPRHEKAPRGLDKARGVQIGKDKDRVADPNAILNNVFGHLPARGLS